MTKHVVEAGENVRSIARDFGFENAETLWNAPENAGLRQKRSGMEALREGDELFVPEKRPAKLERPSRGEQVFTVHVSKVEVAVRLQTPAGLPLALAPCVLEAGSARIELLSDPTGVVRFSVPRDTNEAVLLVGTDSYRLIIGSLAPLPETSGVEARLVNLGYLDGPAQGVDSKEQVSAALEQFQADHGLEPSGTLDSATERVLANAHDA